MISIATKVPVHHNADEYLHACIETAGIWYREEKPARAYNKEEITQD
jgi:hypothetical protein